MRKFLFLSFLFSLTLTFAQGQNSFSVFHFKAKKGGEDALIALFDKQWGDAKFKSGGVSIERVEIGDNPWTHRVLVFGEVGNRGRVEGDTEKNEWPLFVQKINHHIEEWGPSAAGRIMSYSGESPGENPYFQLYEFEAENPAAFKAAFDKVAQKLSKIQNGRTLAFGNYDIGGGGATHWVAIGHKNFGDLLEQKVKYETVPKVLQEFLTNRGNVVPVRNFTISIVNSYGNL
ncbi:MAG: hypothetical protein ACPHX3_03720 [Flavobacteriaceae bacterium]